MPTVEVKIPLHDELRELAVEAIRLHKQASEKEAELHEALRKHPALIGAENLVGPSYSRRAMVRLGEYFPHQATVLLAYDEERESQPVSESAKVAELRNLLRGSPEKVVNLLLNHVANKDERRAILGLMFPGLWDTVSPPPMVPVDELPAPFPERPSTHYELDYAEPAQEPRPIPPATNF